MNTKINLKELTPNVSNCIPFSTYGNRRCITHSFKF